MEPMSTVSIIGGAGHVGLGLGLVLANAGHNVYGIDVNEAVNAKIMSGVMPFIEEDGPEYLARALASKRLAMTSSAEPIRDSDVVIIVLGTPIDSNLNPNLEPLMKVLREDLCPRVKKGQLIVLRSTVSPGTTERVRQMLAQETGFEIGKDLFLVYAPERVLQTHVIREVVEIPQIVGAFDERSEAIARKFFDSFCRGGCNSLPPVEAELAKLMTNMARYVEFALANEFYLIAESHGAKIHRILDAALPGYPRLRVARPGPNVGGPCLHKDGFFLVERIPFVGLISTAFKINEGMPMQVIQQLSRIPGIKKVGILGLTFKAGSDDTRHSLSFKLLKLLESNGYEAVAQDPHLAGREDLSVLRGCDAVVLMTPHAEYGDFQIVADAVANPECWMLDIWGMWTEMRSQAEHCLFQVSEYLALLNPATKGESA